MTALRVGGRSSSVPYAPPRRLTLGADAWQVVVGELGGLTLPGPLRAEDGPDLTAEQRQVAVDALIAAGVLTGPEPLADLQPSVRAGLALHLAPLVVVDAVVRRGAERRTTRLAADGVLASGLARETVETGRGRETGPVEVSLLLLEDLARDVVRAVGDLPSAPGREPARLDAAASLAVVRALQDGRPEAAAAVADVGGATGVPGALVAVAGGVTAVARVELRGAGRRWGLVLLETEAGWWSTHTSGEDVVLRPVDEAGVVTRVAGALTSVLTA